MTLLDRFRSQPPQKHPDATVRLAYLAGLSIDDRAVIAAMAREDGDVRVRRAAVEKLLDVEALGAIARSDAEESVRSAAITMLRDIAVEAFEGVTEGDSLHAVDLLHSLADARGLAQTARGAIRETVAVRALSHVDDGRMLGSIARHGAAATARLSALGVLRERGDAAELLAVAMRGEYKETAAGAVELLARGDLEQVALRKL